MTKKCLLDLPVVPHHRDDAASESLVMKTYMTEREAVQSTDELLAFVRRWQNLWLLEAPEAEAPLPEVQDLANANFDPVQVLHWITKAAAGEKDLPFETDINARIMAHIVLPEPFLFATLLSNHYSVGTDLAMVRLFLDPFPEHADKLRD